jgi:AcrR family transcriptional regulator
MAQRKRNPEKTRAELLRAAGDLLVEEGLRGFTVHGVAEKAGFGKPLVYRYFGARGAVLDALVHVKTAEVEKILKNQIPPKDSPVSENVYHQVKFARLLAGDALLRGLFRALLTGELGPEAAKAIDYLVPRSGLEGDAGAAEAFLLGGISYVLLLRDSQSHCAGMPIETPGDMAAFERAFTRLCSKI